MHIKPQNQIRISSLGAASRVEGNFLFTVPYLSVSPCLLLYRDDCAAIWQRFARTTLGWTMFWLLTMWLVGGRISWIWPNTISLCLYPWRLHKTKIIYCCRMGWLGKVAFPISCWVKHGKWKLSVPNFVYYLFIYYATWKP